MIRMRSLATGIALSCGLLFTAPTAEADTTVTAQQQYQITLEMSECGVMYLGTSGTCIVSLQTWMNFSTGSHLKVDGQYGPATLAAVKDFQSSFGRSRHIAPDGHFGSRSRAALRDWYNSASENGKKEPCDISTGHNCDPGEAKPGLGVGKWQKWTACTVTGRLAGRFAPAVSVFCVVFI
ncbi:peptidoglycan-binding protein [Streptomyces sp. NPDC101152]|uniref:peptidoglycan-binding domain-containing protein n=1 Tax=Streptomyces sp. NPDC101152 TaxID=3366116 RepID=UPI0038112D49